MPPDLFSDLLARSPVILTEGAVIERLRRETGLALDPHVANAGFVYDAAGRAALAAIYNEYLDVAARHRLPILLLTPTWRAGPERVARAGLGDRDVNGDCFRFLDAIVRVYRGRTTVAIGGLMGPAGDAYDPAGALPAREAAAFHAPQARALARAGVGLLIASTLPAAPEARGLAEAMAATGLPYLLSFVVRPDGTLLDGTPIADAAREIDDRVSPPPAGFLVNCVHAAVFRQAFAPAPNRALAGRRLIGFQANTSRLSPEELDGRPGLDAGDPDEFGRQMGRLHSEFGIRLLGGCCGTDARHIEAIALHCPAGR